MSDEKCKDVLTKEETEDCTITYNYDPFDRDRAIFKIVFCVGDGFSSWRYLDDFLTINLSYQIDNNMPQELMEGRIASRVDELIDNHFLTNKTITKCEMENLIVRLMTYVNGFEYVKQFYEYQGSILSGYIDRGRECIEIARDEL